MWKCLGDFVVLWFWCVVFFFFFPFKMGFNWIEEGFGVCRTNLELEPTLCPQATIPMNKLLCFVPAFTGEGPFLGLWFEYFFVKVSCFSRFQVPHLFFSHHCSCSSLLLFPAFVSSRKQQPNQDSSQTPCSSDSLWAGGSEGGIFVLTAFRILSCCYLKVDKDLMGSKVFSCPARVNVHGCCLPQSLITPKLVLFFRVEDRREPVFYHACWFTPRWSALCAALQLGLIPLFWGISNWSQTQLIICVHRSSGCGIEIRWLSVRVTKDLALQLQKEPLTAEEAQSVREHLGYQGNDLLIVQIEGRKPNFEVGSSSQLKLSFAKKTSPSGKAWRMLDMGIALLWSDQHPCGRECYINSCGMGLSKVVWTL